MKGSTHLAVGAGIGLAASLVYPFRPEDALLYVAVSAFSALAADLDGNNLLSAKLGKATGFIRECALWGGAAAVGYFAWSYFAWGVLYPKPAAAAVAALLLGLLMKQGFMRNLLVSLIGVGLVYSGWNDQLYGMMGLGVFVAWAPWLNHRGLTHTVWAVVAWGFIGRAFENELGIQGLTNFAVAGYVSHLLLDTMTPSGVKLLYPLTKKTFKVPF
ncbi:metal-dependent hydrolase [Cohnella massiliensis]|uniref:metal-dependent hydrolase n=1 Tax=Cohnella massiliensis TaxID=1816691 RepID=UPI0009B98B0B|nr:metal-dependent hydrolase [Cohnella massiliensis]